MVNLNTTKKSMIITFLSCLILENTFAMRRGCSVRVNSHDLMIQWTTRAIWGEISKTANAIYDLHSSLQIQDDATTFGCVLKYADYLRDSKVYDESKINIIAWSKIKRESSCLDKVLGSEIISNLVGKIMFMKIKSMSKKDLDSIIEKIKSVDVAAEWKDNFSKQRDAEEIRQINTEIYERVQEQVLLKRYLLFLFSYDANTKISDKNTYLIAVTSWCRIDQQPYTCEELMKKNSFLYSGAGFYTLKDISKNIYLMNESKILNLNPVVVRYVKYFKALNSIVPNLPVQSKAMFGRIPQRIKSGFGALKTMTADIPFKINKDTKNPPEWCAQIEGLCFESIRMAGYTVGKENFIDKNTKHAKFLNENMWTTHWKYTEDTVYAVSYGTHINGSYNLMDVETWCKNNCINKVSHITEQDTINILDLMGCPRMFTQTEEVVAYLSATKPEYYKLGNSRTNIKQFRKKVVPFCEKECL